MVVGFVPLPYQPENNEIPGQYPPTGFDTLRTIAVSRIYLDNFEHITAYWVGDGMKLGAGRVDYGADDLHAQLSKNTFSTWPARIPAIANGSRDVESIREAGRTPIQRNTFYRNR